jgi:ABC-type sugar transport system ATPase subunit
VSADLAGDAADAPILEVRGLAKSYGNVAALREASLSARPGEVLGIVGDNGAGKSTVLKILSGLVQPDEGSILIRGEAVTMPTPTAARELGIATVYQDLALVECLDVATNMALGQFPRKRLFVDRARMRADATAVLRDLEISIPSVTMQVGLLSGGQRQIIAVARAVRADAPIVLLDEPTAALGVRETAHVAAIIRRLAGQGRAVVCISHDLEFVFAHMERVAVMRLGRLVAARWVAQTSREEIVGLITGAIPADTMESAHAASED